VSKSAQLCVCIFTCVSLATLTPNMYRNNRFCHFDKNFQRRQVVGMGDLPAHTSGAHFIRAQERFLRIYTCTRTFTGLY
jgi:hypothetical protein